MLMQTLHLPNRALKIDPKAVCTHSTSLSNGIVFGGLLAALTFWQVPSLLHDAQIRNAPVVVEDGDVLDGECTTNKGIFVNCSAHLVYTYEGQDYETDTKLFFVDLHSGDYTVELVVSREKPELATMSIALDKFWNRVVFLGALVLLFGGMLVGSIVTALRVSRTRSQFATPGRLSLIEVDVPAEISKRRNEPLSYSEPGSSQVHKTLFSKGTKPLIVWDSEGVPRGYAVKQDGVDTPVMLDRDLKRLDLSAEERRQMLAAIAQAEARAPQPQKASLTKTAMRVFLSKMKSVLLLIALIAFAVVGYWLYYALGSSNPHDEIGRDINNVMPEALNTWACGRLKLRFGDGQAPYGCTADDYVSWK
jgi:hypothetical protein